MATYYLNNGDAVENWGNTPGPLGAGNDSTGNGSQATPYATISKVIAIIAAAAEGSSTVYIKKASAYGGTIINLNTIVGARNVTWIGCNNNETDGATSSDNWPTITTTHASYCWNGGSPATAHTGTYTWQYLANAPGISAGTIAVFDFSASANARANVVLDNISIVLGSGAAGGIVTQAAATGAGRSFSATNVAISRATAGSSSLFGLRNAAAVAFDTVTCTKTGTAGATSASGISISDTVTTFDLDNVNLGSTTSTNVIVNTGVTGMTRLHAVGCAFVSSAGAGLYVPATGLSFITDIHDNTVSAATGGIVLGTGGGVLARGHAGPGRVLRNTVDVTGAGGYHAILLGTDTESIEVAYNEVTMDITGDIDYGIVVKGRACNVHHNTVNGDTPIFVCAGYGNKVHHNTVRPLHGLAGIMWTVNPFVTLAHDSTNSANATVTQDSAVVQLNGSPTVSLVNVRTDDSIELVGRTDGINSTAFFTVTAIDDTNKTFTVSPTPTGATGANTVWHLYDQRPKYLEVTENIIDASACETAQCVAIKDVSSVPCDINCDRNVLVAGPGGLAIINGTTIATHDAENPTTTGVAGMRAAWASYTGAFPYNDSESVESDPLFVNATGGDLRIKDGSPAAPDDDRLMNAIGAYGVKPHNSVWHPFE